MFGMQISGTKELEKTANQIATALLNEYNEKATRANLQDAVSQSVQRAPYKTGSLRRSISYKIDSVEGGNVQGHFGADMPYARITELGGTIPAHVVQVRSRKVLYNSKTGEFFGKRVNIPAQYRAARPFLFPVIIEGMERFLARYKKAWERAVSESGGR